MLKVLTSSTKKIDENAVRWVLNMRHAMTQIKKDKYCNTEEYKSALNKLCDQDGHSGLTFEWTYFQAHYIEEHGLDTWIKSPACLK
jgi:hypothetical protein